MNPDTALNAAGAVGGVIVLVLAVFGIILTIMWIILPVLIMSRLKKLIQLQTEANQYLCTLQHLQSKAARPEDTATERRQG
jgi:hypothetical protein